MFAMYNSLTIFITCTSGVACPAILCLTVFNVHLLQIAQDVLLEFYNDKASCVIVICY